MKRQKCAGWQGRHLVKLRELEGYPRGMHRWALIWLLASVLAVLADEASASRHKHLSRQREKAVEVEQHKREIESGVQDTKPLPPDVAAAKQRAIDLVRRHKTKDASRLATSNGDPVVSKLVEWALLRQSGAKLVSIGTDLHPRQPGLAEYATPPPARRNEFVAGASRQHNRGRFAYQVAPAQDSQAGLRSRASS
jgi:hypothetical protein